MKLENKVAIITGGASGIGKACAELFAKEGAKVVIADIDEKNGTTIAKKIGGLFWKTDVTHSLELKNLFDKTHREFKKLDILINNAGIYLPSNLDEISEEDILKTISTNFTAVLLGSRFAIPHMLKNDSGIILSIASSLGIVAEAGSVVYCATKAAVIHITKALALENAKRNIRVNCICPGPIDTPLLRKFFKTPKELEDYLSTHPVGRLGASEEVAKVALFLASEDASYVTGAAWTVDGAESVK